MLLVGVSKSMRMGSELSELSDLGGSDPEG
jgi:hypothetical protein